MSLSEIEKKRFVHSLIFPFFFLFLMWGVKVTEYFLDTDFSKYGVYPQQWKGIPGIFLSPLIHGSFKHLIANSIPWLTLSIGVFYFYNKISYKIFLLIYIVSGFWVWIGAREAYHIGASGLVYGFASFLFVSGVIRNDIRLLSIALIVVFLYGSMIWGIFPLDEKISWESHLMGSVAGMVLAILYRKEGPQKIRYSWEFEEDEEEEEEKTQPGSTTWSDFHDSNFTTNHIDIIYTLKEKNDINKN